MSSRLVLGLGGTVDYEIAWDAGVLADLVQRYGIRPEELDTDVPIVDERSLVRAVLGFVRGGSGGERFVADPALLFSFSERFFTRVTLGGSCVRAALGMAKLGVPATVHLVSIDDTVRRLLPPQVDYLCSATSDSLDPHVIVQFPAGTRVRVGESDIVAPHPNRIILVNDPPNRDLVLSPDLPAVLREADVFMVAGFNVMRDPALLRDRLAFLRRAIEGLPARSLVYYEEAGYHDAAMREIVTAEFRARIDVHGLNEDELQSYLAREVDLLDTDAVAAALADSGSFALAPVVVVHTKYWSLAYGPGASRYRDALGGGIDLASARYVHGDDFGLAQYDAIRRTPVHPGGAAVAGGLEARLGDLVCCVPGRRLDVVAPTTIGLGDTFVGGFVAALGRMLSPESAA